MDDRAVKISKFLSLVLRHQPEKIGLSLDQSGWASTPQLIEASRRSGFEFRFVTLCPQMGAFNTGIGNA